MKYWGTCSPVEHFKVAKMLSKSKNCWICISNNVSDTPKSDTWKCEQPKEWNCVPNHRESIPKCKITEGWTQRAFSGRQLGHISSRCIHFISLKPQSQQLSLKIHELLSLYSEPEISGISNNNIIDKNLFVWVAGLKKHCEIFKTLSVTDSILFGPPCKFNICCSLVLACTTAHLAPLVPTTMAKISSTIVSVYVSTTYKTDEKLLGITNIRESVHFKAASLNSLTINQTFDSNSISLPFR